MSNQWSFGQNLRYAREISGEVKAAHKPAVRQQRNGMYRPSCSCGWEAFDPSQIEREAVKQAIHHLAKIQRQFLDQLDNGVSLPEIVGAIRQDPQHQVSTLPATQV